MEAIGSLKTFADLSQSLEAEHSDVLFFRSAKDPTHVRVVDVANHSTDWEAIAFENGCPEHEDLLALPKGAYLILHSPSGNTSAFYRVRGHEGRQADATALKHSLTILNEYRLELSQNKEALARSEAVSAKLAEMLDEEKKKRKKAKKKLKEAKDGTWERTVETVVETVMANPIVAHVVAEVIARCVVGGTSQQSSPGQTGGGDGFDYEQ